MNDNFARMRWPDQIVFIDVFYFARTKNSEPFPNTGVCATVAEYHTIMCVRVRVRVRVYNRKPDVSPSSSPGAGQRSVTRSFASQSV